MPLTHGDLLIHVIFSTKNRMNLISDNRQADLFTYIGVAISIFNGGAVAFDSQGCKPLVRKPNAAPESRSDAIVSTGGYTVVTPRGLHPNRHRSHRRKRQ